MLFNFVLEKGWENKIYCILSIFFLDVQLEKEKGFVLDCGVVGSILMDYLKINLKLGLVIFFYNF